MCMVGSSLWQHEKGADFAVKPGFIVNGLCGLRQTMKSLCASLSPPLKWDVNYIRIGGVC